jgi:hypothetical protein
MFSEEKDIFMITSVINTGDIKWSNRLERSVFTPRQRFEQTLATVRSIREKIPDAVILLAECSELDATLELELRQCVDYYFQLYSHETIREACIQSDKKGYGELMATKYVVEHLIQNLLPFRRFFKISGRYYLNSDFNAANFSLTEYTFRTPQTNGVTPTVLYSVPQSLIEHFHDVLLEMEKEYRGRRVWYENSLPPKCQPVTPAITCGVSGLIAINNKLYQDLKAYCG